MKDSIGALIPVRLSSERLPGKALMDVSGRPVLFYLLDRVLQSRFISDASKIVVCTTGDPSDDRLVEAVREYGATVFRGDRDDIIKRFREAMVFHDFDAVIQVDGDDPLTATEYMDLTMERLLGNPTLGITLSEGLPLGVNCKSFTRAAMEKVYEHYLEGQNDTGFIYYFTKTNLVKKAVVDPVKDSHVLAGVRLTLDYDVDFQVISKILSVLDSPGHTANHEEVLAFLKARPGLCSVNAGLDEEYRQRTVEKAKLIYSDEAGVSRHIPL